MGLNAKVNDFPICCEQVEVLVEVAYIYIHIYIYMYIYICSIYTVSLFDKIPNRFYCVIS